MNLLFTAILLIAQQTPQSSTQFIIRIGTLLPETSNYGQYLKKVIKDIEEKGKGRLKFVLYAGGVLGDDPEIAQKLKKRNIEAAALSGFGFREFVPELAVIELPFIFHSRVEAKYIRDKLRKTFEDIAEKRGIKILLFSSMLRIYIWSTKPIANLDATLKERVWVWKDDPLAMSVAHAFGSENIIPLSITEVERALKDDHITMVYMSADEAISLGWYKYLKYMITTPIIYPFGCVIMRMDAYNSLPSELRDILEH